MHPAVKVLIGALMVVVGAYTSITFSEQLIDLVLGGLGPLLILLGAFIVWLESDEWKMQRSERKQDETTGLQEQLQNAQSMRKEEKESQRQQEQQRQVQRDYSEILEGTVDEAKEAVREMDEPNYDALIAAEQRGKNRKTLLEWLEKRRD
ncbi:MAG: hypothetical protein ABEJ36_02565 [Candidatus Nanosalina sp.]